MDLNAVGRLMVGAGIALLLVGGLFLVMGRLPGLRSFGNLPGDIRIEGERFSCFFPLVSMILLSALLTLVLNILIRLINR